MASHVNSLNLDADEREDIRGVQLMEAADKAAGGTDALAITWLTVDANPDAAAIVPGSVADYAIRHGWGR